jgi:hypothetical protein
MSETAGLIAALIVVLLIVHKVLQRPGSRATLQFGPSEKGIRLDVERSPESVGRCNCTGRHGAQADAARGEGEGNNCHEATQSSEPP